MNNINIRSFNDIDFENSSVIIYGATIGGKVVCQLLQQEGVDVIAFCDRSNKTREWNGLPLIHPNDLINYPNTIIINALTRSFMSAINTLNKINISNTVIEVSHLLDNKTIQDVSVLDSEKVDAINFFQKYKLYARKQFDTVILPTLEVFITEKCTLRCESCTHLIPNYVSPQQHDFLAIKEALTTLFTGVSKVKELVILGGEPFLHTELVKLLEWCFECKKIDSITILTNGTIVPSIEVLKKVEETHTHIRVSDYGELSKQANKLRHYCEEMGIPIYFNYDDWVDLGKGELHNYHEYEQREVFENCPFSEGYSLFKGALYRCAHSAHMYNLGMIPRDKKDYLNLIGEKWNRNELDNKIKEFLSIKYLNACRYCNGVNLENKVERAKQCIK